MIKYQFMTNANPKFFESLKMDSIKKAEFIESVNEIVQENDEVKYKAIRKSIDQRSREMGLKRKDYKSYVSNSLFINFLKKDYEPIYEGIEIPVLYIIGELDDIVESSSNIKFLTEISNDNIDVEVVEGMNHMLNENIYSHVGQHIYHINDYSIEKIIDWINQVK